MVRVVVGGYARGRPPGFSTTLCRGRWCTRPGIFADPLLAEPLAW